MPDFYQRQGVRTKLQGEPRIRGRQCHDTGPRQLGGLQQNAVLLDTDLLGEIGILQRGGGLTQTAYAIVTDLTTIARRMAREGLA